jgi:hypothetical protein
MEAWVPFLYAVLKGGAYMVWCGYGAKVHGHRDRIWLKGVVYGLLRAVMGAVLGLLLILWLVNALALATQNNLLLYLAVYVPVRWLEWSLLAVVMDRDHRSLGHFLLGPTARSRLWRVGGIAISCLADIPMILSLNGLPVGRFMC